MRRGKRGFLAQVGLMPAVGGACGNNFGMILCVPPQQRVFPSLLGTSFNQNEPMVPPPGDAAACFQPNPDARVGNQAIPGGETEGANEGNETAG